MSNNEEIIGILLDNIDKFYVHSKSRSVEKKIIGNLFNDLYRSYKKIQNMIKSNKIHVNTIVPNTPSDIPSTDLLDSHYCIENLKDIVNQQTAKVIVYSCSIENVKIKIYLNDLTTSHDIHKYTIRDCVL